jgi:hypothetical protein
MGLIIQPLTTYLPKPTSTPHLPNLQTTSTKPNLHTLAAHTLTHTPHVTSHHIHHVLAR